MFPKDLPPVPPVTSPGRLGHRRVQREQPAKPVVAAPMPAPLKPLMSSSVRRPVPQRPAKDSPRVGGSRDRGRR